MTLLRTYRPTTRNSELFNRFFQDEKQDCNQFFAVPPANISENEEDYRIEISAPGFEKSDFQIELDEDLLTISLDKESEEKDSAYVMREFNFNRFKRSFRVSEKIDKGSIEATYKNGILEVILPIKQEVLKNMNRSIEIS